MVDAMTTSRWYFIISMGRKAGHLALGIGKAAGATLTLVPEEFPDEVIRLHHVVDILAGALIKRASQGRSDGVAIIAEGLLERMDPDDLAMLQNAERDDHGNIRLAEVTFGEIVKMAVQQRLAAFGIKPIIVAKNIGYELRCADPIPFDMEYTRDLGYLAAKFLLGGGNGAMVSVQNGHFVPLRFAEIFDPVTNRTKVRMVDVKAEYFEIARSYMLRLTRDDFGDPHELAKFASTAGLSLEEFRDQFYYLIEQDMLYRTRDGAPEGEDSPETQGAA